MTCAFFAIAVKQRSAAGLGNEILRAKAIVEGRRSGKTEAISQKGAKPRDMSKNSRALSSSAFPRFLLFTSGLPESGRSTFLMLAMTRNLSAVLLELIFNGTHRFEMP